MIKVKLREKKISKGRKTLYLDFYPLIPHPLTQKPTRHFTLGLYVFIRPKDSDERKHNEETRMLAESLRAKRQLEVQAGAYDFLIKSDERDFLNFFEESAKKQKCAGSFRKRKAAYQYFKKYAGKTCPFSRIDAHFLESYRKFLLSSPLTQNSASDYFNHLKIVLNAAKEQKMIGDLKVTGIPKTEVVREFLSAEELKQLTNTPFEMYPEIRRAALFSAKTGLRYSDIEKLLWEEIHHSKELGYYIRFRQKKTGYAETLPISPGAFKILGERAGERIFPDLPYAKVFRFFPVWAGLAGITRKITFHSMRHTYATHLLTRGVDLYTVSKMLGHTTLTHTMKYARIIDAKKRHAADIVDLDDE